MTISAKGLVFWASSGIAAGLVAYSAGRWQILAALSSADAKSGASVVAQLSGTMLGFVLAALAILTALGNTTIFSNMQQTGHVAVLLKRMLGSIVAFGVVTVLGTSMLFVPSVDIHWIYVLLGAAVFSIILLADVCRKLWLVLEHL